jgi:hypothetical protein
VRTILTAALAVLLCASACHRAVKADPDETKFAPVIDDYSPGSANVVAKAGGVRYEYCPDNTCELFESAKCGEGPLDDFALMYLYAVSGYTYLERFKTDARPIVEKIMGRYQECRSAGKDARISCLLAHIAGKCSVRIYFRRFFEGEMCEGELNLNGRDKEPSSCIQQKQPAAPPPID